MLGQILKILLICIVVVLIIWWFMIGGFSKIIGMASLFGNPVALFTSPTSSITTFQLPFRASGSVQGPDISEYTGDSGNDPVLDGPNGGSDSTSVSTIGNPSPYARHVSLSASGVTGTSASTQYVTITADGGNTNPIDLSGWSLESSVSGARLLLPMAASPFVSGAVNNTMRVVLDPGVSAIVSSGASPVGTSFRENICSGYLGEHQTFIPRLTANCPDPLTTFSAASANTLKYGSNCADYVQTLPSCSFPTSVPTDLNTACRDFITTTFSYNGCVNAHKSDTDFTRGQWRLYLGMRPLLWNPAHDIIRLLDAEGKTVDVATY